MNRVGQVFYREGWHMVMLVINSYELEGKWMHDFVSLTDLEEIVGPNLVGRVYSWPEETAAVQHPKSSWRQL